MDYDPVKLRLARWLVGRRIRRLFLWALDWLFLRAWYVRRELRRLKPVLPSKPVLLDCGMGFGQFTQRMRRYFRPRRLLGLELSKPYFYGGERFYRGVEGVHLLLGDGQRLPIADATCDLILTVDVMEHVPDDRAAFAEFARALKPGGIFMMHTPRVQDEGEMSEGEAFDAGSCQVGEHVRAGYRDRDARERLEAAGFTIQRLQRGYGVFGKASWLLLQGVPMSLMARGGLMALPAGLWLAAAFLPAFLLMTADYLRQDHPRGGSLLVTARKA